ncbi:MAG: hypothetical protein L6461_07710 [Anaerolineae bacterium]|nr:hypothetical protein [Anaerolineae bacterium]
MAEVKCPMCSKPNQPTAEVCEFCGARITPVTAPLDAIKPGETPTLKNTSDLERTLPGWLRDVRKASQEQDASSADSEQDAEDQEAFDMDIPGFLESEPEPVAALKPEAPLDFLAGLAASADEDEEAPDWLKNLRADQDENLPAAPATTDSSLQDLMSAIDPRSQPQQEQPVSDALGFGEQKFDFSDDSQDDSAFSFGEIESPDWLSALKNQQEGAPTQPVDSIGNAESPPGIEGDLPAWLNDLAGSDSARTASPKPASPINQVESTLSADDTPDWLASLSADTPAPATEADDAPDWLASLSYDSAAPATTPASEADDAPDWLASLSADTPAPATKADDAPDWLASLSADTAAPATTPASEADDAPDWLASLSADTTTPATTPAPGTDDTPDWLASLSADTPAPATEADDAPDWLASLSTDTPAPVTTPASETDDDPDWLASLSADVPATATPPAAEEGDTLDWMASLSAGNAPVLETPPAAEADDTPDWLASMSAETPATEEALPDADMPDWLSQTAGGTGQEQPVDAKKSKAFQTGSLDEIHVEETPGWLASVAPSGPGTSFEMAGQAEAGSESALESPEAQTADSEALEFTGGQPFQMSEGEENFDAILSMDVPDWLAGFTPGELEPAARREQAQSESSGDEEDLAPASLPSWVQALRPMESVVSQDELGEDDQTVEQDGPLAGFRAILPSQLGLLIGRKPVAHSIKLQTDQFQQTQAILLDALIKAEGTPRSLPKRHKAVSDRLLRWVVAAVLLVSVFVPSLLGTQIIPIPTQATSDLGDFIDTIYSLDNSSPVLIVMDYQPALAGEMETALSPVLNDLMIFGKPISFVSTLPTGPLMVSRMMDRMQAEPFRHTYRDGEQFVDLGFLPGDAAGIRTFANYPRETVGTSGFGVNAWDTPVLSGVQLLNDFSAVIVVTDNPDTGRIWVEQAGPVLQGQPMLMVISAQAEPMLIPYYDSGQVRGLLTGLSGGAVYESIRQQPGNAHLYWDSYGFGLIAMQLLILAGGAWSLVVGIISRRKEQEEV